MSKASTESAAKRLKEARESIAKMEESDFQSDLKRVHNAAISSENVFEGKPVEQVPLKMLTPAPREWNFFPPISDGKMLEMMLSIQENGLFNPIILWEQGEGYMILSGHNRVDAYGRILAEYSEVKGFKAEEFQRIPAIIFRREEIDEAKAREIIIDTNYIQREDNKRLMPTIIKNRMDIIRNRKDRKGRTVEICADEMNLSRSKVFEDSVIATKILPELADLFYDGQISKKALLRFAWYSMGVQEHLYRKCKNTITTENVMKIKKNMRRKDLEELLSSKSQDKLVIVQTQVPETLREAFREMTQAWLESHR